MYFTIPIIHVCIIIFCKFLNSIGLARRLCNKTSGEWSDPDVKNCSQFVIVNGNVSYYII